MSHAEQAVAVKPAPEKTPPQPSRSQTSWWQPLLVLALMAYLYYEILGRLVHDWWIDPNFSHGFFVPLFSGYVIWQQRERLAQIPVRPAWFGMVVSLGALATLVVGVFGVELFLMRSSFVFLLAGLVIYFLGWRFFRAVFFPWALLFLMIPVPTILFNQVTFPLQLLASRLAGALLPLAGVPVLREGNVIQLPAMSLEVAEACSGIRSLISLGTLALMYGYFLEQKLWKRVVLALASIPIAVAANALRVVGTGLLVQYWDPDKALGFFHEFSGWVIFIISLALLFAVHSIMRLFGAKEASEA